MDSNKNIHICIVIPPSLQIPTPGREFLLSAPFEGVSYIATVLEREGYKVSIVDCRFLDDYFKRALEICLNTADIVGVATFLDSFVFMEEFITAIKNKRPELPVIVGGSLVTSVPELIMKNINADIAVLGEGELTIVELAREIMQGSKDVFNAQGICYKKNREVIFNKPREQVSDLNSLPVPNLFLWPTVKKAGFIDKITFSTNRGCHFNCSFCYRTIRKSSLKSVEKFREEIKELKKTYGVKYIFLNDLTFVLSKDRAASICDIFKDNDIHWSCMARINEMSQDILEKMKECNCDSIWPGIESLDQEILNKSHKGITVNQILEVVRMARGLDIEVRGLLIIGLPGETEESLGKMIKFVENEDIIPLVKYLTPFPGTEIYRISLEKGLIKNEVEYLRKLSQRKVAYAEDEIINLTELPDKLLRDAFNKIWQITRKKVSVDSLYPGGLS